jgi:hypothetical protein
MASGSDYEESYLLAFDQTIRLHSQDRSLQKVELILSHLDAAMKSVVSSSIDFLYLMKYSPSVFLSSKEIMNRVFRMRSDK